MKRQQPNKKRYDRDYGLDSLLLLILKRAVPVWDQFQGDVPPDVVKQLDEEGDWPCGVGAAAIKRLSRSKRFRQRLREWQE
jgi:hypothetical protein